MGMLSTIITDAQSGSTPVASLLRSVRVLAVRTGARDLAAWVLKERDGYSDDDALPDYRGPFPVHVLAQLSGPLNSMVTDLPIPRAKFPESFHGLFEGKIIQSVASIEDYMALLEGDGVFPWPTDVVMHANTLIRDGELELIPRHGLIKVSQVVPRGKMVNVVESVRNRVLDLALELEQVAPELDVAEAPSGGWSARKEQVSAVYNMITVQQGGQAFVGTNDVQQLHAEVVPGDVASLGRYLDGVRGLSVEQRTALVDAAKDAESASPADKPGRTKAAMKKVGDIVGKGVEQAVTLAVKAGMEHWLGPGTGA